MYSTHCMLYTQHLFTSEPEWIKCAPPLYTAIEPSIDDVYRHIPEWIPFLRHMDISFTKNSDSDTCYTLQIKCRDDACFEITCYTLKRVIILPKWNTLTYGDMVRVLYCIFKKPILIRPVVSDASYVRECTRTMYDEHDMILLY